MTKFSLSVCYNIMTKGMIFMTTPSTAPNLRRPIIQDLFPCIILFLSARAEIMGLHLFGTAAFAAYFDMRISYIGILIICIGLITSGSTALITKYITASLLLWIYFSFFRKKNLQYNSAACTISIIIGGFINILSSAALSNSSSIPHELISSLIEGTGCGIMYIIFQRAADFISTEKLRKNISKDELISTALCAGVCASGLSGINFPMGITLSGIFSIYIIMCISYACSLSSAGSAGLGIGFMCSMSKSSAIVSSGFYGLCAVFGSLLKGFGKFGAAVGFLGGASASLIYSHFGTSPDISSSDIIIGAALFLLTPERLHMKINGFFTNSIRIDESTSSDRLRSYLFRRMNAMANSFSTLANSFSELSDTRLTNASANAADLFEDTARRVCQGCSFASECWEKEFNITYRRMLALLEQMENNGAIINAPQNTKCIRYETFINEFIHIYENYRRSEIFKGESKRSRDIAAEQYKGFADILSKTASSIENKLCFHNDYESELITEFDKNGISLFEISVLDLGDGRLEIYLGLSSGAYADKLEDIIKTVTGKEMEFESENGGIVKLVSRQVYKVNVGFCSVPCDGCEICGDNSDIFDTEDGLSFIIISDGMGCGKNAEKESKCIVNLLKEFLNSGFDAETAIKTINSSLCLQLDRERTASIDMLCIDRTSGIAKLFKIGCAETFFRHGDTTDVIFPVSLPAGIVEEIDMKPQIIRVHSGDILVMATDGVTESGTGEWIRHEIYPELSPEDNARSIISKAVSKWRGRAFDDMTCIVIKIE